MKKAPDSTYPPIPPDLLAQLHAVAAMPDEDICLDDPDAPEVLDWTGAVRGRFYRPPQALPSTLQVDPDVLAWLEAQGSDPIIRMNRILRAAMLRARRRAA